MRHAEAGLHSSGVGKRIFTWERSSPGGQNRSGTWCLQLPDDHNLFRVHASLFESRFGAAIRKVTAAPRCTARSRRLLTGPRCTPDLQPCTCSPSLTPVSWADNEAQRGVDLTVPGIMLASHYCMPQAVVPKVPRYPRLHRVTTMQACERCHCINIRQEHAGCKHVARTPSRPVHTQQVQPWNTAQLSRSADTARPPLGLTETLQEGQRRHSSDLERAESLVRPVSGLLAQ